MELVYVYVFVCPPEEEPPAKFAGILSAIIAATLQQRTAKTIKNSAGISKKETTPGHKGAPVRRRTIDPAKPPRPVRPQIAFSLRLRKTAILSFLSFPYPLRYV